MGHSPDHLFEIHFYDFIRHKCVSWMKSKKNGRITRMGEIIPEEIK